MAVEIPNSLDKDKHPVVVALTEHYGAVELAATRGITHEVGRKVVVGLCRALVKRVQGDPDQVQRYADMGLDPVVAAREKPLSPAQLQCGADARTEALRLCEYHGWLSGVLIGKDRWFNVRIGDGFGVQG